MEKQKIYCAGPLFNEAERYDMLRLAECLEKAGFDTFLPQRDGLELGHLSGRLVADGFSLQEANRLLQRAIFELDTAKIVECDGLLLNLNGRVPDEGAAAEAGIAWAIGKPVVAFKADYRSAFDGVDNPLVIGLGDFRIVEKMEDLPQEFRARLDNGSVKTYHNGVSSRVAMGERGRRLFAAISENRVERCDLRSILYDVDIQ